jgi:hypothetical protein
MSTDSPETLEQAKIQDGQELTADTVLNHVQWCCGDRFDFNAAPNEDDGTDLPERIYRNRTYIVVAELPINLIDLSEFSSGDIDILKDDIKWRDVPIVVTMYQDRETKEWHADVIDGTHRGLARQACRLSTIAALVGFPTKKLAKVWCNQQK